MRSLGMELNIRLSEYGFPCSLASPLLYPYPAVNGDTCPALLNFLPSFMKRATD